MLNFDRFTVKHALKMIATSGFLTDLECTKFVFNRGFAPDPAGGAYSAFPDPLAGVKGTLLLRESGGIRREGREEGEGRGGKGRGEGPGPLWQIPGSASVKCHC